jgi:hypothetical protein
MAKKCIFCGGEPENKNKEHVIPQWLTKYLGRYQSECVLSPITDLKIPFSRLTFPACEKCNSADSDLEGHAKQVVEKLMNSKTVTGAEINVLLDWFDKLRTGIWLGQLMLSKQTDLIDPNFYINDRIGTQDRMLIIERVDGLGQGLGLAGNNTELFMNMPSVFQVWFHNVLITSASTAGLVSSKLGFPRLSKQQMSGYHESTVTITKGTNKTTHPVVMNIDATDKTIIYQPIFKGFVSQTDLYNTQYVQQYSYDVNAGLGGIFVQRNNNAIRYLNPDDKVMLMPKTQPQNSEGKSLKRIYDLQYHLLTNFNNIKTYDKVTQEVIKGCLLQNRLCANAATKLK